MQSEEGAPSCRKGVSRQRMEHQSIVCGWPLEGEQRRKKAGGGGCQELAATTPGFSALSLSLMHTHGGECSRPGQAGGRGQGWAGQSIRNRLLHPLLLPTLSQPPTPPIQAVPSHLHLPRTCERLTFKILLEDSFLHSLPFTSPSKKENSR